LVSEKGGLASCRNMIKDFLKTNTFFITRVDVPRWRLC
jgi:hypothetical protein